MYEVTTMSKQSDAVKRWRHNLKHKIVEGFGGRCMCCGYDKCESALELHHIDPSEKEFSFGHIMANPRAFETLLAEIRKCVLVCSNCHREIHSGITCCPTPIEFKEPAKEEPDRYDECPICGGKKPIMQRTCSRKCAARIRTQIPWETIDLQAELKVSSVTEIADKMGISTTAVYKRMKKLGIR